MLKIYSVQLHEKYQPVPLVSLEAPCHTSPATALASPPPFLPDRPCPTLFSLFLFPVSRAVPTLRAFYLRTLYIFSFSLLCARTCLASRAACANSLFIFQRYDAIRQRLVHRTISRSRLCISRGGRWWGILLIGGVGRAHAEVYRIVRISHRIMPARKTPGINRELARRHDEGLPPAIVSRLTSIRSNLKLKHTYSRDGRCQKEFFLNRH